MGADADPRAAKLANEFRRMTPEAQEEDWIGLSLDLADEKAKRKALKAEVDDLKAKLRDFTGDKDEVIRRQSRIIAHKNSEMFRANELVKEEKRKSYALKKRVDELEAMHIPLN